MLSINIPLLVRKALTVGEKVLFDITPDLMILSIYVLTQRFLSLTHLLPVLLSSTHIKWFINQCGCNNNFHKKCLTQRSKEIVSDTYKTSLRSTSVCYVHRFTLSQTTPFPARSALKWRLKSSDDKVAS